MIFITIAINTAQSHESLIVESGSRTGMYESILYTN
jgi:hypothetical protein